MTERELYQCSEKLFNENGDLEASSIYILIKYIFSKARSRNDLDNQFHIIWQSTLSNYQKMNEIINGGNSNG